MLRKTPGVAFDRESVEFAWLRRPDAKESKTIERKISNAIDIIRKFQADYKHDDAVRSVEAIAHAVAHWHESGLDVAKANDLSYLWLDSLHKKYHWEWVMWDWETGANHGVSCPSKKLTCLADTIIHHTIDGFQPPQIISELFRDLAGVNSIFDIRQDPYTGIGLLLATEHLEFQE